MTEFKELKIDEELRNLLPPLSTEEYKGLEKSILENGFDRTKPIATWKGYIADGHNRYSVCQKHKIPFVSFELASTIATKADVIKWMLDGQLNRRNLSPAQRVTIAKKYEDSIRAVAKENMSKGGQATPTRVVRPNQPCEPTITKNEIAKIAQVSPATVARYDVVMKSDEEDLKEQMKKSDITINKAYDEVKKREKARKKVEVPVKVEDISITPEESESSSLDDIYNNYLSMLKKENAGAKFKDDGSIEAQIVKGVKADKLAINSMESVQEQIKLSIALIQRTIKDQISVIKEVYSTVLQSQHEDKTKNKSVINVDNAISRMCEMQDYIINNNNKVLEDLI